ncbi:MAG: DUF2914 domain-containing protein [Desulfobacterota bacterium]|nr:DUF2914 domain-containing protein [Thermodesulfobacteriota bacterium]
MQYRLILLISILFVSIGVIPCAADTGLNLRHALIAEDVEMSRPVRPAVIFPVSVGRIVCFSSFDSIRNDTAIYHVWYYRDKLVSKKKLVLKAPQWSTYSIVELRANDKGPWRVEIRDTNEMLLKTLRFSITE